MKTVSKLTICLFVLCLINLGFAIAWGELSAICGWTAALFAHLTIGTKEFTFED